MHRRFYFYALLAFIIFIESCGGEPAGSNPADSTPADSTVTGRSDQMTAGADSINSGTASAALPAKSKLSAADSIDMLSEAAASVPDNSVFNDGSIPSSWQNAGFSNPVLVKQFIAKLKVWIAADQVDSIGTHIAYPLKNPALRNAAQFKSKYDVYFTPVVKEAVAAQKLNQVFRNQQGAMIGEGRIWLTEKNKKILIIAINN